MVKSAMNKTELINSIGVRGPRSGDVVREGLSEREDVLQAA